MMKTRLEEPGMVMFHTRRGLLLLPIGYHILAGGLLIDSLIRHDGFAFTEPHQMWLQLKLAIIMLLAAPLTLDAVSELRDRTTLLGADASGLWTTQTDELPGYRIPWKAVRHVSYRVEKPRHDKPQHWIELQLDPGAWSPPVGHLGDSRLDLPLEGLDRPAVDVYSALRRCWERWRRQRQQASQPRVSGIVS